MAFYRLTQPIGCQVIRRRPGGPELLGRDRGEPFDTIGPLRVLPSCRDDGLIGTLREVQLASGAVGLVHERTLARALPRLAPPDESPTLTEDRNGVSFWRG
jgi:hypothetical protein